MSLSSLKWLHLEERGEGLLRLNLDHDVLNFMPDPTYVRASVVTSASWDEDSMISSFVGSVLIVLIGRGLSRRTTR